MKEEDLIEEKVEYQLVSTTDNKVMCKRFARNPEQCVDSIIVQNMRQKNVPISSPSGKKIVETYTWLLSNLATYKIIL